MNDPVRKNRYSVGLTGGIGSGKSTVADLFAELGATVIDTDLIAHQLTAANGVAIPAIKDTFGTEFINASGAMNRDRMRAAVFANPAEKTRLETIIHPLIRAVSEQAAALASGPYIVFVVPLLAETGYWKQRVSRVLLIDCPEEIQIHRVMQRNTLSEAQVRAIMAAQVPRADRIAIADDLIINDNDAAALLPQVQRLHQQYASLAQASKS